jgi:hypothetical protein
MYWFTDAKAGVAVKGEKAEDAPKAVEMAINIQRSFFISPPTS